MCDVHFVNNLQINLLISMNIIDSECININILLWKIIIEECCNMLVNLIIMSQKNSHIWQIIWASSKTVIFLWFIQQVMIKTEKQFLFNNRNLIFHLSYSETLAYIVDANMSFIYVQNNESINMIVSHHICFNNISEYKEENCYTVSIKNVNFVIYKLLIRLIIQISEMWLINEITIYGNKSDKVTALIAIVKIYLDLWHDHRKTVNILETNYLQMLFKENWEQNAAKLLKQVYLLDEKAQQLINKKFDKLHCQEQMKWSIQFTSFGFSVFII